MIRALRQEIGVVTATLTEQRSVLESFNEVADVESPWPNMPEQKEITLLQQVISTIDARIRQIEIISDNAAQLAEQVRLTPGIAAKSAHSFRAEFAKHRHVKRSTRNGHPHFHSVQRFVPAIQFYSAISVHSPSQFPRHWQHAMVILGNLDTLYDYFDYHRTFMGRRAG